MVTKLAHGQQWWTWVFLWIELNGAPWVQLELKGVQRKPRRELEGLSTREGEGATVSSKATLGQGCCHGHGRRRDGGR